MENQRVNRHRSLNFPAELKVEIVDCLPAENAVHFLANVPSRLIIRHCAPRVRQMLVHLIAADYARKLPPKYRIFSLYGHNYTPQMDIFLRYGAVHSNNFLIWGSQGCRGFFGFPANFFDDLIKHCYQTKVPTKAVNVDFGLTKPAPWPTALIQPQAEEMEVEELEVDNRWGCVRYIMRNKHNPSIAFKLHISFNENNCYYRMQNRPICYQQMTSFIMFRVENVSSLVRHEN